MRVILEYDLAGLRKDSGLAPGYCPGKQKVHPAYGEHQN